MVSFRLTGLGRGGKSAFGAGRVAGDLAGTRVETQSVFFGGRFFDTLARLPQLSADFDDFRAEAHAILCFC